MKIVRKTMLNKVIEAITTYDDIIRIELTTKEFQALHRDVQTVISCYRIKFYPCPLWEQGEVSGSYYYINGVCVQTHSSYE